MKSGTSPDIEVGEVNTRIEIVDQSTKGVADVSAIVDLVMQRMRDSHFEKSLREQDDRIRDRSWKTDVKPE